MNSYKNILAEWSRPREFMTPQQRRQKARKEQNNLSNLRSRLDAASAGETSPIGGVESPEKLSTTISAAEHGVLSGHWDTPNEKKLRSEKLKNLLIDILGKKSYSDNQETIQADWDRRNPNEPRDPTGSFGERPRRDVYLNLLGIRNNIKGVKKRDTPLGQRLAAELKSLPDPNPKAGGQWPEIKGETPHFGNSDHSESMIGRISQLIRSQLGSRRT